METTYEEALAACRISAAAELSRQRFDHEAELTRQLADASDRLTADEAFAWIWHVRTCWAYC